LRNENKTVRVRLKGINSRRKVRRDGSTVTYWYAWKGGPRLRGEPGDPEFVASYQEAVSQKAAPPAGVLISILHGYQASAKFDALAERTKRNYVRIIRIIEREFGDFPLSALTERAARGVFMEWRDKLAQRSRRQADDAWVILGAVLSWALDRGLVVANLCQRGGLSRLAARQDLDA
jgi:hypothetical protein